MVGNREFLADVVAITQPPAFLHLVTNDVYDDACRLAVEQMAGLLPSHGSTARQREHDSRNFLGAACDRRDAILCQRIGFPWMKYSCPH